MTASNDQSVTDKTPLNNESVDASPVPKDQVKNDVSENATENDASPAIVPAPPKQNAVKPSDADLDQSFNTY